MPAIPKIPRPRASATAAGGDRTDLKSPGIANGTVAPAAAAAEELELDAEVEMVSAEETVVLPMVVSRVVPSVVSVLTMGSVVTAVDVTFADVVDELLPETVSCVNGFLFSSMGKGTEASTYWSRGWSSSPASSRSCCPS